MCGINQSSEYYRTYFKSPHDNVVILQQEGTHSLLREHRIGASLNWYSFPLEAKIFIFDDGDPKITA